MPPSDFDQAPAIRLGLKEFHQIAALARSSFGLELNEAKRLMVWSRLLKKVRAEKCRSFSEYYQRVIADTSGEALDAMIEALATNFTSFMREPDHFDFLRKVARSQPAGRPLRIWSAATATGEEPYSIAMSLMEEFQGLPTPGTEILATDISGRALATAAKAVYRSEKLQNLDRGLLRKYFLQGVGRQQGCYRIKPEVRQLVSFRRLNLVKPLPGIGTFAVIFCRNVMIYFDRETQAATLRGLLNALEPGGYLMIGHSETLSGLECGLEYVRPAIYRKPESKRIPWRIGKGIGAQPQ